MVTAYLVILVAMNLRLLLHWGILAFPIKKPKKFLRKDHEHKILIQYPVRNEPLELVGRFLKSLETIPVEHRDRFHLQVLDDYDNGEKLKAFLENQEVCVSKQYIRRPHRDDSSESVGRARNKAGNMNYGLLEAKDKYKYVAVFDSDHQVQDLGKMLDSTKIMEANPEIVVVQSLWQPDNDSNSPVSLLQQATLGTHLEREQVFRSYDRLDLHPIMNGAGAVMNLEWISSNVGYWLERAIIEDVDLSYEINRRGFKILTRQDWVTKIDNPESWGALREQWKKWACANGQLFRLHAALPSKNPIKKLFWLSWLFSFPLAPLKYLFLTYGTYRFFNGINLSIVEQACAIPHLLAWIGSAQTWNNRVHWRRLVLYPFQYVLELGILDMQIKSWYKGFFSHTKRFEFTVTPKGKDS